MWGKRWRYPGKVVGDNSICLLCRCLLQPRRSREQRNEKLGNPKYAVIFGGCCPCDDTKKLLSTAVVNARYWGEKPHKFSRDTLDKSDQAWASALRPQEDWGAEDWEKGREARFFYKTITNGRNSLKWRASQALQVVGLKDTKLSIGSGRDTWEWFRKTDNIMGILPLQYPL